MRKGIVALAVGAALTGTVFLGGPSSAQAVAHSSHAATTVAPRAVGQWDAYQGTEWTGTQQWFSGTVGVCNYIPLSWNDKVRSARSGGPNTRVELWDGSNCTGTEITIDGSGYSSIGPWVSSYRVTSV